MKKEGFTFTIKGRPKSIHSIYHKMQAQRCDIDRIYDLFAIRIIIDTPLEREKSDCWQVYSLITDVFTPNPKRLRDWLSAPKENGYESLHTTVLVFYLMMRQPPRCTRRVTRSPYTSLFRTKVEIVQHYAQLTDID